MRNGVLLCKLVNCIAPGSVKRVNESRMPFKQMENISNFLKARYITVDRIEKEGCGTNYCVLLTQHYASNEIVKYDMQLTAKLLYVIYSKRSRGVKPPQSTILRIIGVDIVE